MRLECRCEAVILVATGYGAECERIRPRGWERRGGDNVGQAADWILRQSPPKTPAEPAT